MVSQGRVFLTVAVVGALVLGLMVLILVNVDPGPGPHVVPGDGTTRMHGSDGSRASDRASLPRVWPEPTRAPRPVEEKPLSAPPVVGPDVAGEPEEPGSPPAARVPARLTDERGFPLPCTSIMIQTLSAPKEVLTPGAVRTDTDGRFFFRQPERSNVLHAWCPELRASANVPWREENQGDVLSIQLTGKALVGRLVDDAGQAPQWPGVNIRLCLVPTPGPEDDPTRAPTGSLPVHLDREAGSFVALVTGTGDRDLTVSALGQTGEKLLRRVPRVNHAQPPIVVALSDPRAFFGHVELRIAGAPSDFVGFASLELVQRGQPRRVSLAGSVGESQRTGPLAAGLIRLRVLVGGHVSAWHDVDVRSGAVASLGTVTVQKPAILRLRPRHPDGSVDRAVRFFLVSETGKRLPYRFAMDSQGPVARDVFPARYRVVPDVLLPPTRAVSPVTVDLQPGGLHDVVIHVP